MSPERVFRAELRLSYPEELAKAIYDAIKPDNERLPPGLAIETRLSGRAVELVVECEKSLESLWATLDDLLACVQAAERTLRALTSHRVPREISVVDRLA